VDGHSFDGLRRLVGDLDGYLQWLHELLPRVRSVGIGFELGTCEAGSAVQDDPGRELTLLEEERLGVGHWANGGNEAPGQDCGRVSLATVQDAPGGGHLFQEHIGHQSRGQERSDRATARGDVHEGLDPTVDIVLD